MRSCSFSEAGVVVMVRFGLIVGAADGSAAVWKRLMSPQAASVAAAHSRTGTARSWRLIPILRRPESPSTSSYSCVWQVSSRLALRSVQPGPLQFVALGAPQPSHEHESADSQGT